MSVKLTKRQQQVVDRAKHTPIVEYRDAENKSTYHFVDGGGCPGRSVPTLGKRSVYQARRRWSIPGSFADVGGLTMTQAYPLQWPAGQPRTPQHQRERNWKFRTTQDVAQRKVISEISMLGGRNAVISTNIPLRRDGLPYASYSQKRGEDCAVAAYFDLNCQPMCFACDKWDNYADNMTSIAKTIEALRGIERWGSGHMMKQAFSGFAALPAPDAPKDWRAVLGLDAGSTLADVDQAYRSLLKTRHPDAGGSHEAMAELNTARDRARQDLA